MQAARGTLSRSTCGWRNFHFMSPEPCAKLSPIQTQNLKALHVRLARNFHLISRLLLLFRELLLRWVLPRTHAGIFSSESTGKALVRMMLKILHDP